MNAGRTFETIRRHRAFPYVLGGALAFVAMGVRVLLGNALSGMPFLTFYPAVLLAVWLGGRRAAVTCAFVSGLLAWLFVLHPSHALENLLPSGGVGLVGYAAVTAITIWVFEAVRKSRVRLKVVEAERSEIQTLHRLASEAAGIGFWEMDRANAAVYWDTRARAMFGIFSDEPLSLADVVACIHPDDREAARNADNAACDPASRSPYDIEYRTIGRDDGVTRWIEAKGMAVFRTDGTCIRLLGTMVDVSARRLAADRLKDSEGELKKAVASLDALIANAPIGFAFIDRSYRYVRMNETLAAMNGASVADHVGRTLDEVVPALAEQVERVIDRVFETGETLAEVEVEGTTAAPSGGTRIWLDSFFPVFGVDGKVAYVGVTVLDITERKRVEAAIRRTNVELKGQVEEARADRQQLIDVLDGADVFVQVADLNYDWLAINEAAAQEFARIFGGPVPKAGDNMLDFLAGVPEQQAAVKAAWARALAGEAFIETEMFGDEALDRRYYEMRFRPLRDGRGQIVGAYQFTYDVTERLREQKMLRDAEAALMQAQKMEAVGQLTGGIAHDFNNLLGAILGNFDLIRRKADNPAMVGRFAEMGLQAAERGAKLTAQLLAFSRAQKIELRPVSVIEVLGPMRDLLERTLGPMVRLAMDLPAEDLRVMSDPTQLEMAVLNLAINARDAMPEGGSLTISAAVRTVSRDAELAAGDYVEISVADTGAGMSEEVVRRAFDPFFTTKDVGKGTGLGLSQVYGIARHGGGAARLDSKPGRGTTVRILLPRVASPAVRSAAEGPAGPALPGRQPVKVLVIDDDTLMRETLVNLLEDLGHTVLGAADGPEGLGLLQREVPDLIILDFAMPGMNGADVAHAAGKIRPGIPILFSTGYSNTTAIEAAVGAGARVLRKPFAVAELEAAITDILAPALAG